MREHAISTAQGVCPPLATIRAGFRVRVSGVSCWVLPPCGLTFAMPPSTCDGQLTGQLVETAHLKKMLPELKRACAKMPFLLCGPAGCAADSRDPTLPSRRLFRGKTHILVLEVVGYAAVAWEGRLRGRSGRPGLD